MNTVPFYPASSAASAPLPPPPHHRWLPMLPPNPPHSNAFWDTKNVNDRFRELQDTLILAKAMQKELEVLMTMKGANVSFEHGERDSVGPVTTGFSNCLQDKKITFEAQESLSLDAANSLMSKLSAQLEPFRSLIDESCPWEEKSASIRLSEKVLKSKRNKLWRKRKRKCSAEMRAKELEQIDQVNREADEWRARESAKDAAQLKMAKMKEIAKLKSKEQRKRLETELELVLVVGKLQELRSIRIQKLKKQGHFLPEEDDKFFERVQAAVEEEERQAVAAADTDAAKDAIAAAVESRKTIHSRTPLIKVLSDDNGKTGENEGKETESKDIVDSAVVVSSLSEERTEGQNYSGAYDSLANLPMEFYHYYHGSNNDMGTLIEVRRTWDAFLRPGGSRIPGHWVQPPPPADDIWASYLIRPQ